VIPKVEYLGTAHAAMRSAQPKHAAGAEARHVPAQRKTLGTNGTPRRHTPLRHEIPTPRPPAGPLTAPQPPQAVPARYSHVMPQHAASTAVSGAVSPLTTGDLIPAGTRNLPRVGQPQAAPATHREAIHHQATSAELMARNRERG
jgi:hypothetical protein